VHVSYVEDRITLFDPAGKDEKEAQEVGYGCDPR
jgi:hypothetical protein